MGLFSQAAAAPTQNPWVTTLQKYGITDPYALQRKTVIKDTPFEHAIVTVDVPDYSRPTGKTGWLAPKYYTKKATGYYDTSTDVDGNYEFVELTPEQYKGKTTWTTYSPMETDIVYDPVSNKEIELTNRGTSGRSYLLNQTGDTQYWVKFDESGKPTYKAVNTEDDSFGSFLTEGLGVISPILLAGLPIGNLIGSALAPGVSAAAQTAIGNALVSGTLADANGGDFLKSALTSVAGANIPGAPAELAALQKAGQAYSVVNALESGNLLGALSSGANLAGVGGTQIGDTGYTVTDALKTAGVVDALSKGNVMPLIGALAKSGAASGPSASDVEPGSFEQVADQFDPSIYGSVDLTNPESYTPTTDFGINPDYSLFGGESAPVLEEMGGAQGVQAPELPDVFLPDGTVDYGLFAPTPGGGEPALTMPSTPNLESMGGGQGLTIPVEGGTMTEAGLIPDNYVADLGNPESFINQPAPGADVSAAVQKAVDAGTAASAGASKTPESSATSTTGTTTGTTKTPTSTTAAAQTQQGPDLLSLLGLMSMMGGGQQAQQPVQTPVADVKSFEEQGFGELFGPKLQFSEGGDVADLLKLLRG